MDLMCVAIIAPLAIIAVCAWGLCGYVCMRPERYDPPPPYEP
jgi:hypothetical protein